MKSRLKYFIFYCINTNIFLEIRLNTYITVFSNFWDNIKMAQSQLKYDTHITQAI